MELAAATSKRSRRGGGGGGDDRDRLSALPDCLLHVIMSSLKARQTVQTSVLSTRWRNLWRTVPCLDVDLNDFRTGTVAPPLPPPDFEHDAGSDGGDDHDTDTVSGGEDSSDSDDDISGLDHEIFDSNNDDMSGSDHDSSSSDDDDSSSSDDDDDRDTSWSSSSSSDDEDSEIYYDGDMKKEWEDFEDFTVNLMHHCNLAQLDSFRLHIDRHRAHHFAGRQAAGWLRRAIKYSTPHPASQRGGSSSSSWLLKSLHLTFVHLDNLFGKHVSSVCRSLEDLELHDCTCEIQSVTSQSLKTLILKDCRFINLCKIASHTLKTLVIDGGSNSVGCKMVIQTPAVTYLYLSVRVWRFGGGISIIEVASFASAWIHLQGHRVCESETNNLCGDQLRLLRRVSNATSLELSGVGKTVLGKEPRFQEFINLRNLSLGNCDLSDDFRMLGFFLQGSPNLEKLTLWRCKFPNYPNEKKGKSKHNKNSSCKFRGPDFMCENLKVEIIYQDGNGHQLVKLLLRAAGNLSKNHIRLTKINGRRLIKIH